MSLSIDQLTSGEWRGYYIQSGIRKEQRMVLEFADGLIRGDGIDRVSPFNIEGEYRVSEGCIRLGWMKCYQRSHSVLYCGELIDGTIKGHWEILRFDSDKFELQSVSI